MVQASPFCGEAHEDANAHLQHFLEICSTFTIKGVTPDAIHLRLFPFSLLAKAKQWFCTNQNAVDTWEKCSNAFLVKFFPLGKTNALRNKISSFQQQTDESIPKDWLLIQNFYHGLTPLDRSHLDATAGGAFFSLKVTDAKALIEKMVSNQGWNEECLQPRKRGMHSLKEADMIAAKVDSLAKRLENYEKMSTLETVQAMETHMTCEVCGGVGHSRLHCPETHEDLNFISNDNSFRSSN
jgi:hypothetical protein